MKNKDNGFSLIELLVAMAVLAIISLALVQSFNAISKNIQKNTGEVETSEYIRQLNKKITQEFHDSKYSLFSSSGVIEVTETTLVTVSVQPPAQGLQFTPPNPFDDFGNILILGGFGFENPFDDRYGTYMRKYLFLSHYNEDGNNINMDSNIGIMTIYDSDYDTVFQTGTDLPTDYEYLTGKPDKVLFDTIRLSPVGSWIQEVKFEFRVRHFSTKSRQQEAAYLTAHPGADKHPYNVFQIVDFSVYVSRQ